MASFFFRSQARFLGTVWRGQSSRRAGTFAEHFYAEEEHAAKTTITWRNISLFIAIPAVLLVGVNAFKKEQEHHRHREEHGKPEFIEYSHLRIRSKPFPWGDGNHTLFHNPETNPLPDGYEED